MQQFDGIFAFIKIEMLIFVNNWHFIHCKCCVVK